MPFYELCCDRCGDRMEVRVPISESLPETCPKCGIASLKQVFTHPPVIFMGKAPISFYRKFAAPHYDAKKP